MQQYDENTDLDFDCVFVSGSPEANAAIDRWLAPNSSRLHREHDSTAALRYCDKENTPVMIAAYDVPWRNLLTGCASLRSQPSVVVLLPNADPLAWADALSQGAVDALSITTHQTRAIWTLRAAYRRWERRQLVRQALAQNPMTRIA